MRKKFIYIGLILLVAAFVLLFIAGSLLASVTKGLLAESNVTVASMAFSYLPITMVNQTALFGMVASKPANFYLFNTTGFASWTTAVNSGNSISGYRTAVALEGAGLLYGYNNALAGTVPYTQAIGNTTPFYQTNVSRPFTGTYYAVVDNTNGSASDAVSLSASIIYPSQSGASSYAKQSASAIEVIASGVAFFVLLVAGIAITVYGFIKKAPAQPGEMQTKAAQQPKEKGDMTDEQIDQLYKNIKKKTRQKSKQDKNQ